ncbi:MAG: 5-oxoprolinase subunit PxpB [Desulfobacterales bacterium]
MNEAADGLRFRFMGERSVLVELGDRIEPATNRRVHRLMRLLEQENWSGVRELSPGYRSLLVVFDPLQIDPAELTRRIQALVGRPAAGKLPPARRITLPVFYGGEHGPDLPEVARRLGMTEEGVIRLHTSVTYRVYMIGFTPGFPYLGELPEELALPRRSTPRTRVPKGSVAIAQRQTGVYPVESPGGWHLIGWTPVELFHPDRRPACLLEMGDEVRFAAVDAVED